MDDVLEAALDELEDEDDVDNNNYDAAHKASTNGIKTQTGAASSFPSSSSLPKPMFGPPRPPPPQQSKQKDSKEEMTEEEEEMVESFEQMMGQLLRMGQQTFDDHDNDDENENDENGMGDPTEKVMNDLLRTMEGNMAEMLSLEKSLSSNTTDNATTTTTEKVQHKQNPKTTKMPTTTKQTTTSSSSSLTKTQKTTQNDDDEKPRPPPTATTTTTKDMNDMSKDVDKTVSKLISKMAQSSSSSSSQTSTHNNNLEDEESIQIMNQLMNEIEQHIQSSSSSNEIPTNSNTTTTTTTTEEEDNANNNNDADADAADQFLDGMMKQLLRKDIMMEPILQICNKFPKWLKTNQLHLSSKDYHRYEQQYQCFQQIISVYESEPENLSRLMELMQDIQEFGQPPSDIINELAPGIENFNDDNGIDSSDFPFPLNENGEPCTLM